MWEISFIEISGVKYGIFVTFSTENLDYYDFLLKLICIKRMFIEFWHISV